MENLKPIKIRFGKLFEKLGIADANYEKDNINTREIYVKTPTGELVQVSGFVRKRVTNMVRVELHDGTVFRCSDRHIVLANGSPTFISETKVVDTVSGLKKIVEMTNLGEDDAYDIGIPAPHLYVTPNGVIHHNTYLCLELVKSAQKAGYFVVLYDSEFANNDKQDMIKRGIDPDMLLWVGIDTVESLKTAVLRQLEDINPGEKVAMMIDSIGNLSTSKEVNDATEGKEVRDMTRAQQLKALFRTCTLKAGVKKVPMFIVNHVYADIGGYGNAIGGGTGSVYMSSIIVELSKAQDKVDDEIVGAWITAKSVKNRFARERQKVKMNIKFGSGLGRYTGLFEFFYEDEEKFTRAGNYYKNPWTDHSLLRKDFTSEVWDEILANGGADYLKKRFAYQSDVEDLIDETEDTSPEEEAA